METQTRFDLNSALESWRQELGAQTTLMAGDRRELEAHLRDTFAELRGRGLNEEESFWLARRRVGRPHELAEEFAKADPAKLWRDRLIWAALGLLTLNLWGHLLNNFWNAFVWKPHGVLWYDILIREFVRIAPVICLGVYLALGRVTGRALWDFFFRSRLRFAVCASAMVLLDFLIELGSAYLFQARQGTLTPLFRRAFPVFWFYGAIWPLTLIAAIAWLMPAEKPAARRSHA